MGDIPSRRAKYCCRYVFDPSTTLFNRASAQRKGSPCNALFTTSVARYPAYLKADARRSSALCGAGPPLQSPSYLRGHLGCHFPAAFGRTCASRITWPRSPPPRSCDRCINPAAGSDGPTGARRSRSRLRRGQQVDNPRHASANSRLPSVTPAMQRTEGPPLSSSAPGLR
jgi:hypothetical protein